MPREEFGVMAHCVERPIFVIGTGRSGTTLVFDILRHHSKIAWPCQYMVGKYLTKRDRIIRRLSRMLIVRHFVQERHLQRRPVPEPYPFWINFFKGFSRPCRDLTANDVYDDMASRVRAAVCSQLETMRKERFLTKYTGWSRIEFIDVIFPDALFINVIRDGRAVAWSLLNTDWWEGWRGPSQWRWGELNPENSDIWYRSSKSFFVLAGIQWKILIENIRENGSRIGDRYIEVRYEDLISSPQETFHRLFQLTGLSQSEEFSRRLRSVDFRNGNRKWESETRHSERELFEKLLGPTLHQFGYDT